MPFPQFSQIVQILNAHTESLGWIDRETTLLKQKVEDVKKIADNRKKEREHTFRSVSRGDLCVHSITGRKVSSGNMRKIWPLNCKISRNMKTEHFRMFP